MNLSSRKAFIHHSFINRSFIHSSFIHHSFIHSSAAAVKRDFFPSSADAEGASPEPRNRIAAHPSSSVQSIGWCELCAEAQVHLTREATNAHERAPRSLGLGLIELDFTLRYFTLLHLVWLGLYRQTEACQAPDFFSSLLNLRCLLSQDAASAPDRSLSRPAPVAFAPFQVGNLRLSYLAGYLVARRYVLSPQKTSSESMFVMLLGARAV